MTSWKNAQDGRRWGNIDGPKKGRLCEFRVKKVKKKKSSLQHISKDKNVEEYSEIKDRHSIMLSLLFISKIDDLFWGNKLSAYI